MPKLIQESFSLELKIGKGEIKEGSESKVFLDEEFGIAHAFYKSFLNDNTRKTISDRIFLERLKRAKQAFYIQKILNLIYPEIFPVWLAVGTNESSEIGSERELIAGKAISSKEVPEDKRIKIIKEKFRKSKLLLFEDFLGLNYIKTDDGFYKYIDEVNLEILSSESISRLIDFCEEEFPNREDLQELKNQIEIYGRRILEIQRQNLVIKDGKVLIKK
jgi:hypothetical protein